MAADYTNTLQIGPGSVVDLHDAGRGLAGGVATLDSNGKIPGTQIPMSILLDFFYPIGSYYETDNASFDPNNSFSGTWVLEAEGKVHVSAGSIYTAGTAYGSNEHTHTTGDVTLNISQIPSHNHNQRSLIGTANFRGWGPGGDTLGETSGIMSGSSTSGGNTAADSGQYHASRKLTINATHTHDAQGGGKAHNHGSTGSTTRNSWQPSIAVYRWHRTA